jgi:hypothetical protein
MCRICELLDDPASHTHTLVFDQVPAHDQGAAYFHQLDARRRFWERVRAEVREAVAEALAERAEQHQ